MGITLHGFAVSDRFRTLAMMLCGMLMAMTPPALWFAWSTQLFLLVLLTGILAGVFYCLLARLEEPLNIDYPAQAHPTLSDDALAELTDAGPWIHHHSSGNRAAFKQRMDRLRNLLK